MRDTLLAPLALLVACNPAAPTTAYPTASIYADFRAVLDDTGPVAVRARLRDGPSGSARYLFLAGGESLLTSLDRPPHEYLAFQGDVFGGALDLSEHVAVMGQGDLVDDWLLFTEILLGVPQYSTVLPAGPAPPLRVYVEFDRVDHHLTGESSAGFPRDFQLVNPAPGAALSRSSPLVLAWSNPDASSAMELDLAFDCGGAWRGVQHVDLGPDGGSAIVAPAAYFPFSTAPPGATCLAALFLERVQVGPVSAAFAGGAFRTVRQRTVQVSFTP